MTLSLSSFQKVVSGTQDIELHQEICIKLQNFNIMAHRSQEQSWTVGDLMKKSELIREGKPARYRLITTRSNLDETGKIRKWTFGQREINTQNKIILLVGETGTGKTTLINAIVNYILGVKFEDHVWFEITEAAQNQTEDQTESQTTEITVYEVLVQNSQVSVTIIDTPGYGDTRGKEYDIQIADNLRKLFKNDTGVNEIDAVCLVVKASDNRLSDRQHYIFDAVLSLFGKDIEENIVIFATHSDGGTPTNAINAINKMKIPCKKTDPFLFLFNNRQAEEQTNTGTFYEEGWKGTEKNLTAFFTSLKDQSRKSLYMTERVLTEQIRLKACVSNLRQRIELKQSKQKELVQIQKELEQNQIQGNVNLPFNVTKYYKEKFTIENASWWDRKATCCSVCKENCHESNCWCAINPKLCEVMKNGYCTVCTGKCHHSKHIRENKKYVIKSKNDTMTFTDLIKLHEITDMAKEDTFLVELEENENKNYMKTKEEIRFEERLKAELIEIEKDTTRLVEEACTTIIKLSKITLKPDNAFIVKSLDFLIPRAEENEDTSWVQTLKKLRKEI